MLDNMASHTVRNFKLRGIVLLQGSRSILGMYIFFIKNNNDNAKQKEEKIYGKKIPEKMQILYIIYK